MKRTEIIINDISMVVRIPTISQKSNGEYSISGYGDVRMVDPRKLAKFLEKHIKTEDLIED